MNVIRIVLVDGYLWIDELRIGGERQDDGRKGKKVELWVGQTELGLSWDTINACSLEEPYNAYYRTPAYRRGTRMTTGHQNQNH